MTALPSHHWISRVFAPLPLVFAITSLALAGYLHMPPAAQLPGTSVSAQEFRHLIQAATQDQCAVELVEIIPRQTRVAILTMDDDWYLSLVGELAASNLGLSTWASADWVVGDSTLVSESVTSFKTATCLGKTFVVGQK